VKSNVFETKFFGYLPWIIIQRVTLPLVVFYHFHSGVVFIELFKEVYDDNDEEEEGEEVEVEEQHEAISDTPVQFDNFMEIQINGRN
jgi:hypothetical protein